MPIRLARHGDIPTMARVLASSFGSDKLFQVLFPYQQEHPDDFERAFRYSLQAAWWDYSKVLLISYEDVTSTSTALSVADDDASDTRLFTTTRAGHTERITGLAEWQRVGAGWTSIWNCLGRWDPRRFISKLIQWRTRLIYIFRPCQASARSTSADPDPLLFTNFLPRMIAYSLHLLEWPTKPWRRNHWSLETLAVHPRWHGRKLGRELRAWGVVRARGEGVPCVVVAAAGKEGFYQKCGFTDLVGYTTRDVEGMAERNPMGSRGIGGGAVLWSLVEQDEDALIK